VERETPAGQDGIKLGWRTTLGKRRGLSPTVRFAFLLRALGKAPRRVVVTRSGVAFGAGLFIGPIDQVVERWLIGALERTSLFKSAMTTLFHGPHSRELTYSEGQV